ncbi:MAG: Acyl-CoA dehydrogenase fadE12 [Sphingomonas bacterium]|uniref:acyl-CoA dehydrogenase family protein n=1 Tax=Sphingomonas bacterium TaxID=1895847 RepID=UPI00260D70E7|nr:acyl-CoA dehydrogenase family protein [Sphingomonas bacterium]MDB5703842.1 Acyl-CoA dehydrogenase fadE12 [Sphingomonas bacterium]
MDFELTDDQRAIRDAVTALMKDYPDEYWEQKDDKHEFPWEFYNAFAEAGFLGVTIPEEYGGSGLGLIEAMMALGPVSGSGAGLSGATPVHVGIFGMTPVVKFGSEEMKRKYLPALVKGDLHVCFGITEPDAGTDTTSITTNAKRDGDHYVINGRKVWTSKAEQSSKCMLLTRTTPLAECKRKTDGMTLFLADLDPDHVTIRPIPKMGRNAVSSCEVWYDDLRVHESDRIGEEGQGFKYLLDGLNAERILVAWQAIKLGQRAIERATQYAKDRKVFGRAIGQNQGIQFPLADSYAKLEAAEILTMKAAWQYDNDLPCGELANIAKYLASEAAFEAADRAVQTHGGYGYAREYHVERYFREARVWKIAPISQNLVLSFVAEKILGLPRSF